MPTPTERILYGSETAITITLNALANGSVAWSNAIDASLFGEMRPEAKFDGTAAATAWLDMRLATCIDGGTDYDTWEAADKLKSVDLSVDLQIWHDYHLAAQSMKYGVKNNTGAALAASGNAMTYQGMNRQIVQV